MSEPVIVQTHRFDPLHCSFCARSANEAGYLCAGAVNVAICIDCAGRALEAMGREIENKLALLRAATPHREEIQS